VALLPLDPRDVIMRQEPSGRWYYLVRTETGGQERVEVSEMFHLKNFSLWGPVGMSAVAYGAQSLGATRAADKTAAKMFKSALSSSGFLETGQILNEPDRARLKDVMNEYMGSDNAGKLMIL